MSAPHPGKWKPVFEKPPQGQPAKIVLDTDPFMEIGLKQIASHAIVIVTDLQNQKWKVLYGYPTFLEPTGTGKIRTRIWDPDPNIQNPISFQEIPHWPISVDPIIPPRLFCGGHVFMPDGKLLWTGGIRFHDEPAPEDVPHPPANGSGIFGLNYTYIFNPNPPIPGQEWKVAGEELGEAYAMKQDRFYPTLTQLGETPRGFNGKVVAMSGFISWIGNQIVYALRPEIYDEATGWNYMPYSGDAQPFAGTFDYYPSAHLIPSGPLAGQIFYSIPMVQARVFDPFWGGLINGGYWAAIGGVRTNRYRLNGTSTMLPLLPPYNSAKVLIIGGATAYGQPSFDSAEIIDIATATAATPWTLLPDFLFFARKNHTSVILPNDMLFIVGGNVTTFAQNIDPVLTPELVDTSGDLSLGTTMLPAHVYPRAHHSTAVLLPDATVWVSGQGKLGENNIPLIDETNIEIYEPGYLHDMADPTTGRPVLTSGPVNNAITYGVDFNIETSHPIAASPNGIRLIRLGAITHSTDMTQLSVGLAHVAGPVNGNTYSVTPPPNANVAPPGLYMLFVLRPKSASLSQETMIPSVAKIVMLS